MKKEEKGINGAGGVAETPAAETTPATMGTETGGNGRTERNNFKCHLCGYNPEVVRRALRRTMGACEFCGRFLCGECLKKMAVETRDASEADAAAILEQEGAAGFMKVCEESHMVLCIECFEAELKDLGIK